MHVLPDCSWIGGVIIVASEIILPALVILIFVVALIKKVDAYEAFISGCKEGLGLFVNVFSSLLAMMLSISLLRESGVFDILSDFICKIFPSIPAPIFPLVMFRPISGSASLAILIDIFKNFGPDSLAGKMASVIQGSTDTTLYVITLYFSTVGIKKIKNSLWIGLFADFVGITLGILLTLKFMS